MEELNRDLYIRGEIWNVGDVVKTTDGDEGTIIEKVLTMLSLRT